MHRHPDSVQTFRKALDTIIRSHERGSGGIRTALLLTRRLDILLQKVYKGIRTEHVSLMSIVAIGGYGRKELCFFSDVDVMILVKNEADKKKVTPATEQFLHDLLDAGLSLPKARLKRGFRCWNRV
jgi:[protein-PII] uridylyltransferase